MSDHCTQNSFQRHKRLALRALSMSMLSMGTLLMHAEALAQSFPTKPITIVVPTAAGGANDAMARIIAQGLQVRLGQPVVVDNKAGANGAIASEFVARAPADGHTILFGYIATHGMNPALQKLKYDPIADFEPIGLVASSPTLMVATNSLPVKNASEFVALSKSKPGVMNYASAGKGTAPHFAAELFKMNTGADMEHVPYKGSAPAIVDTIGGTTQVMFPSLFTAYPQVKGGKIKALGLAGAKRSPLMPDVPTFVEQGLPAYVMEAWFAVVGPKGMTPAAVKKVHDAVVAAFNDAGVRETMAKQGNTINVSSTEQAQKGFRTELAKYAALVKKAGITPE